MAETYTEEKELPPAHFFTGEFVLKGSTLPDPKVKFYLYDRVVNVRKCIAVPYGAKGTVIGIYGKDDELSNARGGGNSGGDDADTPVKLAARDDEPADAVERLMAAVIEVLFDEPFDGGLKTRSTKANIYKMQAAWLINLTYGVKAGGSGAVGTRSAHFRNSYQPIQQGMMMNGYGQQGQGLQPKSSTPKVPVKQHQPPYLLAVKGPPPKFDNVGGGSSAASVAATAALARAGIGRMVFKNPNYYQPKPNHQQQQQQPNHQPNYHQQQQLQLLQKFNHSETSPFKILTRAAGVGVAPNNTQANGGVGGEVHHQQPQQQLPQQQQQPLPPSPPPPPVLPPQPLRPTAAVFEPVLPSVGYTGAQISQLLKDMMNINGGVGGTAGTNSADAGGGGAGGSAGGGSSNTVRAAPSAPKMVPLSVALAVKRRQNAINGGAGASKPAAPPAPAAAAPAPPPAQAPKPPGGLPFKPAAGQRPLPPPFPMLLSNGGHAPPPSTTASNGGVVAAKPPGPPTNWIKSVKSSKSSQSSGNSSRRHH